MGLAADLDQLVGLLQAQSITAQRAAENVRYHETNFGAEPIVLVTTEQAAIVMAVRVIRRNLWSVRKKITDATQVEEGPP